MVPQDGIANPSQAAAGFQSAQLGKGGIWRVFVAKISEEPAVCFFFKGGAMPRRPRGHKKRVRSEVTVYGATCGKAIESSMLYTDRLYKPISRGFDKQRGKFFIKLKHTH